MTTDRFRVNARFDRVAEEQVRYIVEQTGMSVSEVLKESVAQFHERLRQERATPYETMEALGLIGAFEGRDPEASVSIKQTVARSVERKLGSR